MKLKLHSIVNLITNSSTVLYTDSSKSVEALEDVIREMFKIYNVNKEPKEIFDIGLDMDDLDEHVYEYILGNYDSFDIKDDHDLEDNVSILTDKYVNEINLNNKKPDWLIDIISSSDGSNWITINAKDSKYEYLAILLKKLIYSIDVDEE